jgi:hypothetical protein
MEAPEGAVASFELRGIAGSEPLGEYHSFIAVYYAILHNKSIQGSGPSTCQTFGFFFPDSFLGVLDQLFVRLFCSILEFPLHF